MNKTITLILSICLSCILVFYLLIHKNDPGTSGFKRNIVDLELETSTVIPLADQLFGFCGAYKNEMILRSYKMPSTLFKVSSSHKKLDTLIFPIASEFHAKGNGIFRDCLDTAICLSNPYGDFSLFNGSLVSRYTLLGPIRDNFQLVSARAIVARATTNVQGKMNRALQKIVFSDSARLVKQYLFPDCPNGYFANDGWLYHDQNNHLLFYLYYYKGIILKLDTNLNLLQRIKTIDTVTEADIKTGVFETRVQGKTVKQLTQTAPPKIVNRFISVSEGKIYVLSRLKADHEEKRDFFKNEVIDVYQMNSGKYLHSFYIPKYMGAKISNFKVAGHTLSAIFETHLLNYNFREY